MYQRFMHILASVDRLVSVTSILKKKNMMFKKKTLVKYLVKKYDKNNI